MTAHACGTHKVYQLSCEDYDELVGDGGCWRCGRFFEVLHVDHDHALGINAVRGALCGRCNTHMAVVDGGRREPDYLDVSYRAKTWHIGRVQAYQPDTRTPHRPVRVDDTLWTAAAKVAAGRRETLSAVIKRALVEYVESNGGTLEDE